MKQFNEQDFAVLRKTLESGRQSPSMLGGVLILSIIMTPILFLITYIVMYDQSTYPYKDLLLEIHLYMSILICIFSILFAIPTIYRRFERIQYLIIIIVSQNIFAWLPLVACLFLIGKDPGMNTSDLIWLTIFCLIVGIIIFAVTLIRFYGLLKKGAYRLGTSRDRNRSVLEDLVSKNKITIILASVGLVYIIQFLIRSLDYLAIDTIVFSVIGLLIYFAMQFVLPEQLVMLYCKYKFESFNHNKKGGLKPMKVKRV
ncbi:hypothetical protein [Terribacillus aidingensis]|uniref:hypothetical protein n=1 Tax=Terribacillus aidingensis TaxID=586416 RepID=UPI00344F4F04